METFEEEKSEKGKKAALSATRRQMLAAYDGEPDMQIIVQMSVYFCALQNSFVDGKSRKVLEALSREEVFAAFAEGDAAFVWETLKELLLAEPLPPVKPVRKKFSPENPRAYFWKPGDIYAYQLVSDEAKKAGLAGKYALIYCVENRVINKGRSQVICYLLLKQTDGLSGDASTVLAESVFLPYFTFGCYRYSIKEHNSDYPCKNLIYVGNVLPLVSPGIEYLVKGEFNKYSLLLWERFEQECVNQYDTWKKMQKYGFKNPPPWFFRLN